MRQQKGDVEMYKNRVEKFSVGNNVDMCVLREESEQGIHYALLKIGIFGKITYAICALGDGYALEVLGENESSSTDFFELVLRAAPSPCHIFDIVSDFRRENL